MNDLDVLRSTLDQHAADVGDHDLGGRVGSVHRRVRVARRRRRTAVAGGAAVAVVAALGVGQLASPSPDPEPAGPRLAGVPAPASMDALGYTYELDRQAEGDGRATLDLAPSDTPRLVSWATAGEDDRVSVQHGEEVTAYDVPDFSDFVWVDGGERTSISVEGAGRLGLAVYELTDAEPPGVSGSGVTYRELVAGDALLAAAIGEPGEAELRVSTPDAPSEVRYRYFCANGPRGAVVHVDGGDGGVPVGSCDEGVPFDPGSRSSSVTIADEPGRRVARLWVTDGEDGALLDSDEVVLGVGVYDSAARTPVGGFGVAPFIEHDGHLWRHTTTRLSEPGDRRVRAVGGDAPLLAFGWYAAGRARVVLEHTVSDEGGGSDSGSSWAGESGSITEEFGGVIGVLRGPGEEAAVRVEGAVPAGARLAVALYEQAD